MAAGRVQAGQRHRPQHPAAERTGVVAAAAGEQQCPSAHSLRRPRRPAGSPPAWLLAGEREQHPRQVLRQQVDVAVSSWDRGPDVLISGKTMFSSYGKNTKNRYEETVGEAVNLRDRHPLAAMGYAFIVSVNIFEEQGAYARLQDLLRRTRKPDGPNDATLLLVADWDASDKTLDIKDSDEAPDLGAAPFFGDLLNAVITNTPVGNHQAVREGRDGKAPTGGAPNPIADAADAAKANRRQRTSRTTRTTRPRNRQKAIRSRTTPRSTCSRHVEHRRTHRGSAAHAATKPADDTSRASRTPTPSAAPPRSH